MFTKSFSSLYFKMSIKRLVNTTMLAFSLCDMIVFIHFSSQEPAVANSPALTCLSPQNLEEGAYEWMEGGAKGGGSWI